MYVFVVKHNAAGQTAESQDQTKDYKVIDVAVILKCLTERYTYNLWTLHLVKIKMDTKRLDFVQTCKET